MITATDEGLHPAGSAAHWQESYYFNWSSPDSSEFGFTRIGLNLEARTADALVVHLSGGTPELVYASVGTPFAPDQLTRPVTEGLTVGGLSYTMDEPLGTWHLQLEGAHTLDLRWTSVTPVIDFHDSFPGDTDRSQEHFEQVGRVVGHLVIDGTRHEIDAWGERDKSWGVRDWNGLIGWDWIAGQFGEDLAFNATRTDVSGELLSTGFVWADGEVHTITDVQIDYSWVRRDQPEAAHITVTVDSGRRWSIDATARGRIPLLKSGLWIEETQSRFTMTHDGTLREGVGIMEHAYHVSPLATVRGLPRLLPVMVKAKGMSR